MSLPRLISFAALEQSDRDAVLLEMDWDTGVVDSGALRRRD